MGILLASGSPLDTGDNDPTRFLTYFIAALNQVDVNVSCFSKSSLAVLQSPQAPPIETVLPPLINEIAAAPDKSFLVLNGYHLIEAQAVQDALNLIIENQPPNWIELLNVKQ